MEGRAGLECWELYHQLAQHRLVEIKGKEHNKVYHEGLLYNCMEKREGVECHPEEFDVEYNHPEEIRVS